MAGYTPVFDSVYAGSLCGRWPTTAVWVTLLPLCDKYGHIDLSYQAICALTGWPLDLLQKGIAELMKPDPDSRSAEEEGRRLVLLDPNRQWGWRVVNHGLYREKARKLQYDNERTASGRDAARKRMSRDVPRCPDTSREVPLSDADADSREEQPREGSVDTVRRGSRIAIPFPITTELREWAKSETPDVDVTAATAEFVDYWRGVPGQKGCKLDWVATWRNRMRDVQARQKPRRNGAGASEWR
jgi:hypothetical protein